MTTTDCVACEHGPYMKVKNYLNNQPKHTIGMRQTASTQVTDVRFAKLGKDAGRATKVRLRRLHRLKAKKESQAASLVSKHMDMMHIAIAI